MSSMFLYGIFLLLTQSYSSLYSLLKIKSARLTVAIKREESYACINYPKR